MMVKFPRSGASLL